MRRAAHTTIAVALLLAAAGCRTTDPKTGEERPGGLTGLFKGRPKDKDDKPKDKDADPLKQEWLKGYDKLPGTNTGVPKAGSWADDPKAAAQDAIGGRVLDPFGRPARNVLVRIVPVGTAPTGPTAIGSYTGADGYFLARGLKAGKAYDITAEGTFEGKPVSASVQAQAPNAALTLALRDDAALPPAGGFGAVPPGAGSGTFPPDPKPTDGAWAPGGGATGVPPATIGGNAPKPPAPVGTGGVPPPDLAPIKPENTAEGPKDPFKPPAASIPGPAGAPERPSVPPLPKLPPPLPPAFGPGGTSSRPAPGAPAGRTAKLELLDVLERPWTLDSVRGGDLVLLEFTTSTCLPCKQVIPAMRELQSRYGAGGLQVVAVLCDNVPLKQRLVIASKYATANNLNYALYVEPGEAGSVRDRYEVEFYPHAVLLDSAGRVLWTGPVLKPEERAKLEAAIKQNLGK